MPTYASNIVRITLYNACNGNVNFKNYPRRSVKNK